MAAAMATAALRALGVLPMPGNRCPNVPRPIHTALAGWRQLGSSQNITNRGEPPMAAHRITSRRYLAGEVVANATVPVTDVPGPWGDRGPLGARPQPDHRPGRRGPHDPPSAARRPAGGPGAERPHEHRVPGSRRAVRAGEELRAGAPRRRGSRRGGPRPLREL